MPDIDLYAALMTPEVRRRVHPKQVKEKPLGVAGRRVVARACLWMKKNKNRADLKEEERELCLAVLEYIKANAEEMKKQTERVRP